MSKAEINFTAVSADLDLVNQTIRSYLSGKPSYIKAIGDYIISSGGKRLRPVFAILIAKIFGYQGDNHIKIAAAVEAIHSATLLHDDVVDDSELRRGNPTSHTKWGNKASILVGDFLFSQAFMMMVATDSIQVLKTLSQASAIIAEGEVMQLAAIQDVTITQEHYLKIVSAKTAELFAAACKASAIIAGCNDEVVKSCYEFGKNLGISFQIIDDILDYEGLSNNLGKKIGDDFFEGKITLPIILALQKAPNEIKDKLLTIWNQATRTMADFETVQYVLIEGDFCNQAKAVARSYIEQSKLLLQTLPYNQYREILETIVAQQLTRVY